MTSSSRDPPGPRVPSGGPRKHLGFLREDLGRTSGSFGRTSEGPQARDIRSELQEDLPAFKQNERAVISQQFRDTIVGLDELREQYKKDFGQTLRAADDFHALHRPDSVLDINRIKLYRVVFLVGSCLLVAVLLAGVLVGFLLGALNHRETTSPMMRGTASNMGGIILIT
ncbi:hypothetical protein ISCGN_011146 [Ixodes scapularis]